MFFKTKLYILLAFFPTLLSLYHIINGNHPDSFDSALGVVCLTAFCLLYEKFPIVSQSTCRCLMVFIILSLFVGRALEIYFIFPQWDKILHFSSGFILVSAGSDIYARLTDDRKNIKLYKAFILLFAIAFAGVWELYEFSLDKTFKTVAQLGLDDTMWDMALGTAGAIIQTIKARL